MLINFSVSNFLSFYEKQCFSMEAGKFRNHSSRLKKQGKYKLLKFMSIYGANASGKTNLVSAMGVFRSIVIGSFKTGSYPMYCKVNEKYKEEPSSFEIKVLLDGKVYIYGFKAILSKSSFTEEWLYEELQNGSTKSVFKRDISSEFFSLGEYINSNDLKERLSIYGEDIRSDSSVLFLKVMNQNKASLYQNKSKLDIFRNLYSWIKFKLDVNSPENPITNYSVLSNPEEITKITQQLSEFETGISKCKIVQVPEEKIAASLPNDILKEIQHRLLEQRNQQVHSEKNIIPSVLIRQSDGSSLFIIELNSEGAYDYKTITFEHKNSNSIFSLADESDGTIRLLDIIEILLTTEEEKVYVIDEINRKFHPLLTKRFINEFLKLAESRGIQLIVTTHESQLMDLKLLRRDEICFVDKSLDGYSTIHSLDEYNVRFDKIIITEYLKGSYGAVPFKEEITKEKQYDNDFR